MTRNVDGLTSSTLKHLRERWWNESFTTFLKDTLQPKSGRRILDVGCGTGTAEVNLSRLRLTQVNFVAVDLLPERVAVALAAARATNFRAGFAAADACSLPFPDATSIAGGVTAAGRQLSAFDCVWAGDGRTGAVRGCRLGNIEQQPHRKDI